MFLRPAALDVNILHNNHGTFINTVQLTWVQHHSGSHRQFTFPRFCSNVFSCSKIWPRAPCCIYSLSLLILYFATNSQVFPSFLQPWHIWRVFVRYFVYCPSICLVGLQICGKNATEVKHPLHGTVYDLLEVMVTLLTTWRRCLPGFSTAKLLFPNSSHEKGVTKSSPHPGRGIKLHLLEEEPQRICQN